MSETGLWGLCLLGTGTAVGQREGAAQPDPRGWDPAASPAAPLCQILARGPGRGCARRWQHGHCARSASPCLPHVWTWHPQPLVLRGQDPLPVQCPVPAARRCPPSAGDGAGVRCSMAPLAIRAPPEPPPAPRPRCLCPTLVSPGPRAHQRLPWLRLLTGLGAAGLAPPRQQPFISSAVGSHHITPTARSSPRPGPALPPRVPAVPAATLPAVRGRLGRGCVPVPPWYWGHPKSFPTSCPAGLGPTEPRELCVPWCHATRPHVPSQLYGAIRLWGSHPTAGLGSCFVTQPYPEHQGHIPTRDSAGGHRHSPPPATRGGDAPALPASSAAPPNPRRGDRMEQEGTRGTAPQRQPGLVLGQGHTQPLSSGEPAGTGMAPRYRRPR